MTLHVGHVRMLRLAGTLRRAGKVLSDDGLAAEWRSVDAVKAAAETPIERAFSEILDRQESAALEVLRRDHSALDLKVDTELVSIGALLLDAVTWAEDLDATVRPLLLATLQEGYRAGALRIDADLAFQTTGRSLAVLEDIVGKVQGTTETTQAELGRIVKAGLEDGADVDEIASRIAAQFTDWKDWRAKLVAQTSVTPTFAVAQQDAFLDGGVTTNRWLTQRDGDVRPEHDALDGEEVEVGQPFSNGLAYPQEPNCRCDVLPVLDTAEKSAPVERHAARNAYIRKEYDRRVRKSGELRDIVLGDLSEGEVQGHKYALSVRQVRRIVDER